MKILPILFYNDMVKAILNGKKTCTRRIVKPTQFVGNVEMIPNKCRTNMPNEYIKNKPFMLKPYCDMTDSELIMTAYKKPYQPGDILYVRETWSEIKNPDGSHKKYVYKASDNIVKFKWHPSIYMPKTAARIWLKVTNVKVERLQDIDINGIRDEGLDSMDFMTIYTEDIDKFKGWEVFWFSIIKKLGINKFGWDANPWVWVIEFELCDKDDKDIVQAGGIDDK